MKKFVNEWTEYIRKGVRKFQIKVYYKRGVKKEKMKYKKANYNKMEYCLGNGLELLSALKVFAICHDSSVFRTR